MAAGGNNRRRSYSRREETFLGRWSRRKHAAGHGAPDEETGPEAQPAESTLDTDSHASAAEPDITEDEATTTAEDTESADPELPHPDTLDRNSDFSVYLSRRVSSTFRRAAMRRLFSSSKFNVRDGLDDYDEDYTGFQSLGNTVTAHMRHHAERLRKRDEEKAEQAERDAEAERERTAERSEADRSAEREPDTEPATDEQQTPTTDDPTPAEDAPEPTGTARTATNRDTDDTT
ncbi:MAG: DUF3306 domain-containing protein [Halofilum sp. (in: g-proteobacteria)]